MLKWRQLYFVEAEETGLVKIGIANDARARLASLQTSSPAQLTLRGVLLTRDAEGDERRFHHKFAHLHSHGEWFRNDDQLERTMGKLTPLAEAAARQRTLNDAIEWPEEWRPHPGILYDGARLYVNPRAFPTVAECTERAMSFMRTLGWKVGRNWLEAAPITVTTTL